MSLRAFIRSNSAILMVESIMVSLLGFVTYSVLLRVASREAVGLWVLVSSFLAFSRIMDIWSNGLTSFVGEARGKGDMKLAVGYVSTSIFTGATGYLAIIALSWPILYFGAGIIFGTEHVADVRHILPLMLMTFWLQSMASLYQLGFLGFERPGFKVAQTIGGALLFLGGAVIMAPKMGLMGILYAQAIQAGAMLLFAIASYHLLVAPAGHRGFAWHRDQFGLLVRFGSKMTLVGIFQLSIEPMIRLMVNHFGSLSAVAIVDLAARLISFVRALCTSLGQILVPGFAMLATEAAEQRRAHYREAQKLFLFLSVLTFSALLVGGPLTGRIMLGHNDASLPAYIALLSIGWFANTLAAPAHFLLLSLRLSRKLLIAHVILALGAAGFGTLGGFIAGDTGALAGASLALILSALYLAHHARQALGSDDAPLAPQQWKSLLPLGLAYLVPGLWLIEGGNSSFSALVGGTAIAAALVTIVALLVIPVRHIFHAVASIERKA